MQRCGRGEEVRNGRGGYGKEASLRVSLGEEPIANLRIHGKAKMTNEGNCPGGRVGLAGFCAGNIAPGAVQGFEPLKSLNQFQQVRRRVTEVLISPESNKRSVSCAVREARISFIAAVRLAERFDAIQEGAIKPARHPLFTDDSPTAGEGRKVDEIETLASGLSA